MAKALDPVCGRTVDTDTKYKSKYMGVYFYFCSAEDKAEFDKDPMRYHEEALAEDIRTEKANRDIEHPVEHHLWKPRHGRKRQPVRV